MEKSSIIIILSAVAVILLIVLGFVLKNRKLHLDWIQNLHDLNGKLLQKGEELEIVNRMLLDGNEEISQQREEIKAQAESLQETLVKLRELNEFREGLTAMIVHDLKAPLNLVLNKAENKEVEESGRQMLNMINNILDVQKFETTEIPVKKSVFILSELVNEAIGKVSYLAQQKNISITNSLKNKSIEADEELMERIFINLLSNAIKYTPINGIIEIYAESISKEGIKVYVKDNGPGIPESLKDRVFDKFMQVIAKKSGDSRSFGLGLTFCKLAIEAHNETIGVDTEVGKGTKFWFTLPYHVESFVKIEKKEVISEKIVFDSSVVGKIAPYIRNLRSKEVFEVSDIQDIIDDIRSQNIPEIDNWLKALENSVYSVNQKEFSELLNHFS